MMDDRHELMIFMAFISVTGHGPTDLPPVGTAQHWCGEADTGEIRGFDSFTTFLARTGCEQGTRQSKQGHGASRRR